MDAQQMQNEEIARALEAGLKPASGAAVRKALGMPPEPPSLSPASMEVLQEFAEQAKVTRARQEKLRDAMAKHLQGRRPTSR